MVFVCAREIVLTGNGRHFSARGGAGGSSAFGSAGGGGGGGGAIMIACAKMTGTLNAEATAGFGGTGFGNRAASGIDGKVFLFQV